MEQKLEVMWPAVFTKGHREYQDKRQAVADAYCGWAICMSGNEPTDKFGEGMAFIQDYLAAGEDSPVSVTPEGLDEYCKQQGF